MEERGWPAGGVLAGLAFPRLNMWHCFPSWQYEGSGIYQLILISEFSSISKSKSFSVWYIIDSFLI